MPGISQRAVEGFAKFDQEALPQLNEVKEM